MTIDNLMKKLIVKLTPVSYNGKYLHIDLHGGLCNKLHCLFSACDIALKKDCTLIEPFFGWKERILFSDIYDIDYFNEVMSPYNQGKQIMISRDKLNDETIKRRTINSSINLWSYSEKELVLERLKCNVGKDSTKLKVLKALRLKPELDKLVTEHTKDLFTSIQIRIENDWVAYAKKKVVEKNETLLIDIDTLLIMLSEFNIVGNLFFTSGERHNEIYSALTKLGITPFYFFNPEFEYEINAAINFEICCKAHSFIGLSRSSYSNLITLKRAIVLENENSFIYNLNNKISPRVDKGLQPIAIDSVTKETTLS